jgi:hypothetical protein
MARKLVVRSLSDEVFVADVEKLTIRELTGAERKRMIISLTMAGKTRGIQNAILGDDVTEIEAATNHEKIVG